MRIVYISGVWDLFHIGHRNALKRASELGDFLIAGVVTDEFAESYKGEPPVIPFMQRYGIVSSIRYVDVAVPVTSFDIPPCEYDISVRAHGPDYGTYPGQQVVLRKFHDMGIETVLVPRTPNVSTTLIRQKVRDSEKNHLCNCGSGDSIDPSCVPTVEGATCLCCHPIRGRGNGKNAVGTDGGVPEPEPR